MSELTDRILGHVSRPDYRPATLKTLAKRLELPPEEYSDLRSIVKELARKGQLEFGKDRTVRATAKVKAESGAVIGTFRRSARGFGFVRPKASTGRDNDIFIAPDEAGDASTGDEVAIKITGKSNKATGGRQGRILRIVSRATALFVGSYFESDGEGYVKIDGSTFNDPVLVGDPGAKGAQPGDKVALEMVRYPSPVRMGEGVITEVLGPRGQPGVDTLTVIRAFGIPDEFDASVLDDARHQADHFHEDELGSRLDLRDQLTVTIDPATARDFDDAISLDRDEKGHWRLGVHIADVSHFVRTGSPLDRTARQRGTSVYLPDRVIPMLPELLSNGLASLQENRTRFTLTAFMEFDPEGRRTSMEFARSAIRVDQRFTYEQAFAVMSNQQVEGIEVTPEVKALLGRMLELAMILRKRRFQRGSLELVMPDIEIDLDKTGQVSGAHLASNDQSHQVIEECMLAANEAVAEHLTERKAWFLRRGHADPDPIKLKNYAEFVRSLGYPVEQPQSRFELQKILAWSDSRPERHAVHFGLLRSLKQATYTIEPEGHFALASENYCHFTSPIRRYPDLQVHRQLVSLIEGRTPKADPDELGVLAEHCTRTEKRAEAAERELIKIKLLTHLETKIGELFHAVLTGVEEFGLFCQLVELPIDGLLHVTSLADDFYYLEAETHSLVGRRSGNRFRLGDRIEVRVARVDIDRRELDLIPSEHHWDPENAPFSRVPGARLSGRRSAGARPSLTIRRAKDSGSGTHPGSPARRKPGGLKSTKKAAKRGKKKR